MGMLREKDIPDDIEAIQAQIRIRKQLQQQMVGQLYPSVLEDEINRLRERLRTIRRGKSLQKP